LSRRNESYQRDGGNLRWLDPRACQATVGHYTFVVRHDTVWITSRSVGVNDTNRHLMIGSHRPIYGEEVY
jgi:hypothetical protein